MNIKITDQRETTYDITLQAFAKKFGIIETISDVNLVYPGHTDGDSIHFDKEFIRITTKHTEFTEKQIE